MKKRMAIAGLLFLFVVVLGCFAQEKAIGKKTVIVGATQHQASLTWNASTTCTDGSTCTPTGYKVYRAAAACPGTGLPLGATVLATVTTTTYSDTTITPGTYCYYVTATNSAGESAASNTAGGTLAQPAMAAPTNFSVTIQ